MSFIPASQITAGSDEYLHANLRNRVCNSAEICRHGEKNTPKNQQNMLPSCSKHSKLLLGQSRCGGNGLKTEILLKISQESSINGQITCLEIVCVCVCEWRALLKQLVRVSCRLMFNVISIAIRTAES